MKTPDVINGMFEIGGGLAILLSIIKLMRDRQVRGFHWGQLAFYTLWGLWNTFYYPHLDQWWSFMGGMFVVYMNSLYLGMIARCLWEERYGNTDNS